MSYYWRSLKLRVSNGIGWRRLGGGGYKTQEPKRRGFESIELDVELEVEDAIQAAHLAGTQSDVVVAFTDPSSTRSLTWTLHNCKVRKNRDSINRGVDIGTTRCTFRAFADAPGGTDYGIKLVVVNQKTTGFSNG